MLSGRRRFDHQMDSFSRDGWKRASRRFQLRYTGTLAAFFVMSFSLIILPMLFFFWQNYQIFFQLSLDSQPALLEHLQREKHWVIGYTLLTSSACLALLWFGGLRATHRVAAPMALLKQQLGDMARGKRDLKPLRCRSSDEFLDIVASANYLQKRIQEEREKELSILRELFDDLDLNKQATQLGLKLKNRLKEIESLSDQETRSNATSEAASAVPFARHVS